MFPDMKNSSFNGYHSNLISLQWVAIYKYLILHHIESDD